MLDLLIKWREDPKTTDDKTIVISQFTAALDLVDTYLSAHSFKCVGYKGGMSRASRAESVRSFMEDDETQVLLLSLKAGGLGLNLTRANRVILLDPGWNVAVEYQAFARCHRLGQHKQVFVHRLVIKGTLEERMLREYQARKASLVFHGRFLDVGRSN
ncbi:hypothetical protein K439DRAFT_1663463 [Ramaria rubella]|nr:hypothetical protein K439DRAFT_1663463 [Ramaria rubella]